MKIILFGENQNGERLELIEFGDLYVICSYNVDGTEINREWFKEVVPAQDAILDRLNSGSPLAPAGKGISVVATI